MSKIKVEVDETALDEVGPSPKNLMKIKVIVLFNREMIEVKAKGIENNPIFLKRFPVVKSIFLISSIVYLILLDITTLYYKEIKKSQLS